MSTKFLICLMVLFSACTSYTDKRLEYALELASENRQELEKVLEHYQNDPEKLMATRFLIENMPRWYGYEGRLLDSIRPVLAAGAKKRYIPKEVITKWQEEPFYSSKKVYDVNTITADYMIENIDQAFEVYKKYPWNKNLPFDDFCELILPYRIGDEPLTDWRRLYRDRYMPLLDSLYPGGTDVVEACRILANELKKESEYYSTDFRLPRLGGEFLLNNRIGYCRESCDITLYVMRACGIPIAIDFFEYSPEYQQGHMWTVVRDTTDKYLPFWYTQFAPRRDMKDDGRKTRKDIPQLLWIATGTDTRCYSQQSDSQSVQEPLCQRRDCQLQRRKPSNNSYRAGCRKVCLPRSLQPERMDTGRHSKEQKTACYVPKCRTEYYLPAHF